MNKKKVKTDNNMNSKYNYNHKNKFYLNNHSHIPAPIKIGNNHNVPIYPKTLKADNLQIQYGNNQFLIDQKPHPQLYITKPKNLFAINGESKQNNMWGLNQVHYSFPAIEFYSQGVRVKPRNVYDIKRPKERLLKGQNQLILEKLQAKYSLLGREKNAKIMPKTGVNFYKKKKKFFAEPSRQHHLSSHYDKNHLTNQSKNSNSNISVNTFTSGFFNGDKKNKDKDNNDLNNNAKDAEIIYSKLNADLANKLKRTEIERISIRSKDNSNMENLNRNSKRNIGNKDQPLTERDSPNRKEIDDDIQINDINNKSKSFKGIDLEDIIKPIHAKKDETIKESIRNATEEEKSNANSSISILLNNNGNMNNENKSTPNINKEIHSNQCIKRNISKNNSINEDDDDKNNEDAKRQEEKIKDNNDLNPKQEKKRAASSYFNMSNINVSNIINQVFENNRKAAVAQSKNFFQEIGKDYKNNQMRKTQQNFFTSNSKNKFTNQQQDNAKTLNFLELKLITPLEWRKHEEIWANISSLISFSNDLEKHLIPPNENDVLVSSYIKLFPAVLNFCSIGNICTLNQMQSNCLTLSINDRIQNPKLEMKKWKDAYKRVVLRWHPDKLFAILNEIKLKDEAKRGILKKKSSIIINNMNLLFKQIMEILKKISLSKVNGYKNNNGDYN